MGYVFFAVFGDDFWGFEEFLHFVSSIIKICL